MIDRSGLRAAYRQDEQACVAERLRQAVGAKRIAVGNAMLELTISVGVAAMHAGMTSPDSMIKAADQAVYAAKQAGRDRTCVYRPRASGEVNLAASA